MNLKNAVVPDLIGQTLMYRGQFWRVDRIDLAESFAPIKLVKTYNDDKGCLSVRQLVDCRLYPTREQITKKHSKLIRALRWSCSLTVGEAEDCIHGFITTGSFYMGSEALSHIGGSLRAIRHAISCRNRVRRDYASMAEKFLSSKLEEEVAA